MWGRVFTIVSFFLMYALCYYWAKTLKDEILLICKNADNTDEQKHAMYYLNSFYLFFVGVTWFRVWKRRNFFVTATHAMIIAYATYQQLRVLKYYRDNLDHTERFGRKHVMDQAVVFLAIIQFILSVHLIMVRYGRTPAEKSFRSGLHSFFGTLIFIGLWFVTIVRTHHFPGPNYPDLESERSADRVFYAIVGFLPWMFVLVNPYWEWRRLYVMFYTDPVEQIDMKSEKGDCVVKLVVPNYEEGEEEDSEQGPREPTYAGVTADWLRETILQISRITLMSGFVKYKAAVQIQSQYRGYNERKRIELLHTSAKAIQRTWRGYVGRQRYYRILETELTYAIKQSYVHAATLIQAVFRGFYSRKYIHDHLALNKFKLATAEELLFCVALKTRDYLKNHQLPGVYTLRNSKCLSKVEKLLALTRLKHFNHAVRAARTEEISKLKYAFERSEKSKERTELPFGMCRPQINQDNAFRFSLIEERLSRISEAKSHPSDLSLMLYKRRSLKD